MRKYSFSHRVINEWNKLPNDCVNASSVNMFKHRIDRYLIRAFLFLMQMLDYNYCSWSQCFNTRVDSVYAVMLTTSWLLPDSG